MTSLFLLASLPILATISASRAAPDSPDSNLRTFVEQFWADQGNLERVYVVPYSDTRRNRMTAFYADTLKRLTAENFDTLNHSGQVDYILLRNYAEREIADMKTEATAETKFAHLIPFAKTITDLEEKRRRMEPVDSEADAKIMDELSKQLTALTPRLGHDLNGERYEANQAAIACQRLHQTLQTWFNFYNGYDPLFTWWCDKPYQAAEAALTAYRGAIKQKLLGVAPDDDTAIVGNPIGRAALIEALHYEMIPYTPEELLKIADEEYAWCLVEMKKASHELGYGDDWKKALEHIKQQHVEPGQQPQMIRALALEAIDYVKKHDLVTVPPLAEESWRMTMMSPERQLVSPFFLGGETIMVSYPTNTMDEDAKLMSMRGNNRYFARATVQHELIPGHHLQGFMQARYKPYREGFETPFWIEGWALYWEMFLYDMGFPRTPEEKIGMLFWRMHRCVRIQFSLRFHMGELTPEQCIDMLVDKVGHERANAEGEVRRSLRGDYAPLYQAAYMIGGLQIRALRHELVDSGKMTNRQFHDAILHENSMPIEMVRAALTNQKLTRDFQTQWRFRG